MKLGTIKGTVKRCWLDFRCAGPRQVLCQVGRQQSVLFGRENLVTGASCVRCRARAGGRAEMLKRFSKFAYDSARSTFTFDAEMGSQRSRASS
jgi:hypothetical protein